MNLFNRLPGSRRAPPGLEWKVLKKLPAILFAGTVLAVAFILLLQCGLLNLEAKESLKFQYVSIGLVLFHWMSILVLALVCIIVVVMKGHAYVMDSYQLPDSDLPRQ
jgi:hypothetical protein